jgi:transcriptional regulator with XRE-family HTH domain
MKTLAQIIGENIRRHREGKGLTQAELGFPRRYVGQVELGRKNLTLSKVSEFGCALHIHPADLFRHEAP